MLVMASPCVHVWASPVLSVNDGAISARTVNVSVSLAVSLVPSSAFVPVPVTVTVQRT